MDEFTTAKVYPHMPTGRFEKDEVARQECMPGYGNTRVDLIGGGARNLEPESVEVHPLYEPRAIHTAPCGATPFIRDAFPRTGLGTELILNHRHGIR